MSTSFSASVGGTVSDLDGFSITGDNGYPSLQSVMYHDTSSDFGFDPPNRSMRFPVKVEQTYSPPDEESPFGGFEFDHRQEFTGSTSFGASESDCTKIHNAQNATGTVSRYGQITPPRSNSEPSLDRPVEQDQNKTRQRRSTKSSIKEEPTRSDNTARKRKNTRKDSFVLVENPEENEKRRQSLEKNRLAAAKCRVNKKEKTEQLQRASHDKAVENSFLKEQIMRMKEEAQQMNALLLAHANCEGCKSPEDIQKHLNNLGNEFLAHHMSAISHDYSGFANMQVEMDQDHCFSPTTDSNLINPPLPDFDRESDFDVTTPMQTD